MKHEKANPAMHFFLYLLHFFSLAFVAVGFGSIIFQAINKFLPMAGNYAQEGFFTQELVNFGIASIFVAGPLFYFTARMISRYLYEGIIGQDSRTRRWLTYIVLFIASDAIVGDLITLIVNFLNGADIAGRFLLKVLTILLIAGSIFGYYFWDIRREVIEGKKFKENRFSFFASSVLVFAAFIFGFFIIDGPKVSREKNIDIQTVGDLQNIDNQMMSYYYETEKIPENIDQLKNTKFYPFLNREGSVEYKKTGENAYQLCANFSHSNFEKKTNFQYEPNMNQWDHGKGKVCFERIAVKEGIRKDLEMLK